MPKLVIKRGDVLVKKLAVPETTSAFTVGCERGNDIIIKDDSISYFHLQVEQQNKQYYVRDLQSQWGTFVNGFKISTRTSIGHQDEIKLGSHKIVFLMPERKPDSVGAPLVATHSVNGTGLMERIAGIPRFEQLNSWLINEDGDLQAEAASGPEPLPDPTDLPMDVSSNAPAPTLQTNEPAESGVKAEATEALDLEEDMSDFLIGGLEGTSLFGGTADERETSEVDGPDLLVGSITEEGDDHNGLHSAPPPVAAHSEELVTKEMTSTPHAEGTGSYYLLGIYGHYLGRRFKVKEPETRIGRDRKLNDIVISKNAKGLLDQSVSRRHATLRHKGTTWLLSDKRSKSRTRLNGIKLGENDELPVIEGDEIEIISDQKSHIFRLVREGAWDYAFPKKAGSWSVRKRMSLVNALSALVLIVAISLLYSSLRSRHFIVSQPGDLIADETYWASAEAKADNDGGLVHPAVADLNADGYLDIIYINNDSRLSCIDGKSKDPLWPAPPFKVMPDFQITLDDLDDDGRLEVIVVGQDNTVRILDGAWGIERDRSPILAGPLTGAPIVADLNGDRLKDLAIASSSNRIHWGRASLRDMSWKEIALPTREGSTISAGNVIGRGANIILASADGNISFIDVQQERIIAQVNAQEEFSKATGQHVPNGSILFPVALGDFDGDDYDDFVINTVDGHILAMSGRTRTRLWYDLVPQALTGDSQPGSYVIVGDLDGDKQPDVVSLTQSRQLKAIKGFGAPQDHKMVLWEQNTGETARFAGYPILADFNKNGTMDVVAATDDGTVYIFEGATGEPILRHHARGPAISGQPMIADLDRDNHLDIITLKKDGYFYKLRTSTLTSAGVVAWGQAFGNSRHTNATDPFESNTGKYNWMITFSLFAILSIVGIQLYLRRSRTRLGYY